MNIKPPKNHTLAPVEIRRTNPVERYIDSKTTKFIKIVKKLYARDLISDKQFLTLMYRLRIGRWIRWKNPKRYTEKLQWLKLYNRQDEYTSMVDKIKSKEIVARKVGEKYVVPTIGVWNSPEEIEFDKLPPTFVLKCNHASAGNFIQSSPDTPINKRLIIDTLNSRFHIRWDKNSGEWPYRNVEKKVFAEEYLPNLAEGGKPDYKILCFHGEPKFVQVFSWTKNYVTDYKEELSEYNIYYDLNWSKLDMIIGYPYNNDVDITKPENLEEMIEIARKLSEGIPFVKVDFYNINGKIYVGELTFFPFGGFGTVVPDEWDEKLGEMLKIK